VEYESLNLVRGVPTRSAFPVLAALVALAAPAAGIAGELNFTPYIWIPGVDGSIGTGGGGGGDPGLGDRVSVDFSPEYRIGGAMLNFSWRQKRFTAFGDWTYANVRAESPSPVGLLYSSVKGQIIGNVAQLFAGYLLLERGDTKLDVFAGARGYGITGRLGFEPGLASEVNRSSHEVWVDAATGLRFNTVLARSWVAHLRADVGTGGSNLTWQAYAVGGYQFSWGALLAGWRHLYVDKGDGSLRIELSLSGPVIGVNLQL
jgi:hypothetical protein